MPTFRGRKVGAMLRDMERRRIGFRVALHHLATEGDVVLTDRTDYLTYGRWGSSFAVRGTFEVREGRITLWDDHFSPGAVLVASLKGLGGLLRR
jgi:limonene-1,2-epoxide hydrolase